jgi:parvulin-like peptidyl-prolyl isomerase
MLRTAIAALAAVSLAAAARAEIIDQILATVDTEPILQSEVMTDVVMALQGEYGEMGLDDGGDILSKREYRRRAEEMLPQALDDAINSRLLLREAVRAGAQIDEEYVDDRIQRVRDLYDSEEALLEDLARAGDTLGSFRDRLRRQMLAAAYADRKLSEFEEAAVVSEDEIRAYYEDNKDQFERPVSVVLRTIYMQAPADAEERAVVRARMKQLVDELEAGADFTELASEYSEPPYAESDGLIGAIQQGDFVPAIEERVFALEAGERTGVIELDSGFHVMRVEERKQAESVSLADARSRIEARLRQAKAQERFEGWLAELRKSSRVQVFL